MLDKKDLEALQKIFNSYPEIIAVYLFGSYLEKSKQGGDIDLAVLLKTSGRGMVNLYMDLHPRLAEMFAPLEVDLLFLNSASLPVCFEVIKTGRVVYSADDISRTDFEDLVADHYMDFRHHLETARRELYEAVKEGGAFV